MKRRALAAGWLALVLTLGGCVTVKRAPPPPSSTRFSANSVTLPAKLVDNFLIVETKGDRNGPFHFLVDTGSSVTLAAPAFAALYALPGIGPPTRVEVRSSDGGVTELPSVMLRRIDLGAAKFTSVPALIYDTSTLSADLGIRIDAILGFPFFHDTLLTLDYPGAKIVLHPPSTSASAPTGTPIPFDDGDRTPIVQAELGASAFSARIDSGIDEALNLNPAGLDPRFAYGPVVGRAPYTVAGGGTQRIGRLADAVTVAGYPVPRPVAELTDGTSAIGGGILVNFVVTFAPEQRLVYFYRNSPDPIAIPGPRTPGLSFDKTPAYWRVASVVPGSPAAAAGIETGDLVTRIDGRPVSEWDLVRYDERVANAEHISFTFLQGTREVGKDLRVIDLVP